MLRGDFARERARWQRDMVRHRMRWYRDLSDWRREIRRQIRVESDSLAHPDIQIRPEIRVRPMRFHRGRYQLI